MVLFSSIYHYLSIFYMINIDIYYMMKMARNCEIVKKKNIIYYENINIFLKIIKKRCSKCHFVYKQYEYIFLSVIFGYQLLFYLLVI